MAAADVIFSSDSRGSSVLAGQGGGSAGASPRPQHSDEFSGYQVTSAYEAHKAKWQATPFYLSSSSNPPSGTTAAVHPDDVDIDSIPMVRLTTADLEGRGGGKNKKGGGKKGHRKQQPGGSSSSGSLVMPVLKDDVMPEGAKDSDDDDDHQGGDRRR